MPPFAARAIFEAALATCPPDFKREYGPAMRRDYSSSVVAARTERGTIVAVAVALSAVSDVISAAIVEYASMIARDLRYALRSLRHTPVFTAIVVATLAIAIGANAAVFSIVDAVVLAPLPYAEPDRLVALDWSERNVSGPASLPDVADAMAATGPDVFTGWAAFIGIGGTVTGLGEPLSVREIVTTPGLFGVLGLRPELGRFDDAADARPGSERVAVVSDAFWRSAFHAAPMAIGSLVRIGGVTYRVIGVAPAAMRQPVTKTFGARFEPVDVWTFVPPDGRGTSFAKRGDRRFDSIARLAPNVSTATATAMLARATGAMRRRNATSDAVVRVSAQSLTDSLLGGDREVFFAIFAGVAAVLLVAFANVTNLLLGRAASRDREISIRTAVGASRGRILGQLLVEAFVLASIGAAFGIALAAALVRIFVALHPPSIARADDVTIGVPTLVFMLVIVAVATVATSLVPALSATRPDIATALKSAGRGTDGSRGARAREGFVASEIAITFALVVVAGLVLRSFVGLTTQPLGFDPAGVRVAANVDLTGATFANDTTREVFEERVLAKVSQVPGVRVAAWANDAPFMKWSTASLSVVGRSYAPGDEPEAEASQIDPGYFRVLGVRLISGRFFDDADRPSSQPVAIVNERFAKEFLSGRSPIGTRIRWGSSSSFVIVGVVADIRSSLLEPVQPQFYQPLSQQQNRYVTLLVDVVPDANVNAAIGRAIAAADPLQPRPALVSLASLIGATIAVQRLELVGLAILAMLSLGLAAAGIFGVVSFGVMQRTHEFGIRRALGSSAGGVLALVLSRTFRLVGAGIVAGMVISAGATRFVRAALFETSPIDPATFALVTALVLVVALVAALLPAMRAMRVDPIVALRYE